MRSKDAAEVVRLLLFHVPDVKKEAVVRMTGLGQSTVSRISDGAGLRQIDKSQQVLDGMGVESAVEDLALSSLDEEDLGRVHWLMNQSGHVDASSVNALAQMLATHRRLDDLMGAEALVELTRPQARTAVVLADRARGPHARALRLVAAEWVQFDGWLHASTGRFATALPLLDKAEAAARELDANTLVAQARNFRAYIHRRRGDVPGLVRHFMNAHTTAGAHPSQQVGDAIQAAHGHALLGERDQARRLLEEASVLAETTVGMTPPRTAYWLTPTFHQLSLGLAHLGLSEKDVAVDRLRAGLYALPADQQNADWTREYRQALSEARR